MRDIWGNVSVVVVHSSLRTIVNVHLRREKIKTACFPQVEGDIICLRNGCKRHNLPEKWLETIEKADLEAGRILLV